MKNSINQIELNLLNNKQKRPILATIGMIIYYILKIALEIVYIITCVICKIIEVIAWTFTIGTAFKVTARKRYKRR